jgi:hypothetical protein
MDVIKCNKTTFHNHNIGTVQYQKNTTVGAS